MSALQKPGICNSKLRFVPKTAVGRGRRLKTKQDRGKQKYIQKKRRDSKKKRKRKKQPPKNSDEDY